MAKNLPSDLGKPLFAQTARAVVQQSPFQRFMKWILLRVFVATLSIAFVGIGGLCFGTALDQLWASLPGGHLTISLVVWHQRALILWLLFVVIGLILTLCVREFWKPLEKTNPIALLLVLLAISIAAGAVISKQDAMIELKNQLMPKGEIQFLGQTIRFGSENQNDDVNAQSEFISPNRPGKSIIQGDRLDLGVAPKEARVPTSGEASGQVLSAHDGMLWIVDQDRQVWRIKVMPNPNGIALSSLREKQWVRVSGEACGREYCAVILTD